MSTNELTTPLGVDAGRKAKRRIRIPVVPILGAIVTGVLLLFVGWIIFVDDPLGGEPIARTTIENATTTAPTAESTAGESEKKPSGGAAVVEVPGGGSKPPNVQSADAVEEASGVKVIRSGQAGAPTAVIISTPDSAPRTISLSPPRADMTDKGRQGSLPKIGPNGERPLEVYARPVVVPPALAKIPNLPRVAILVGGLGISQSGTASAIQKLPPDVTLAFAPYGDGLSAAVAKAREQGHEVLLQSPMEPFDYPDNDPGPQTLLTDGTTEQNLDRLRWQLSRFPGYVGVVNYMGARFTSNEAAMSPVIKELTSRGLLVVDDGSSARSVAGTLTRAADSPFAAADVVIVAEPTARAIDAALAELEAAAKQRGSALGVATGLPVSVDRIAAWAGKLAERGILLVPVTGLIKK